MREALQELSNTGILPVEVVDRPETRCAGRDEATLLTIFDHPLY